MLSLVHAAGTTVVTAPVTLSLIVAFDQSYCTVSGQRVRYQRLSVPPPTGTVNCWLRDESPLVGDAAPTRAAACPLCAPLVADDVEPAVVQPARPDSKPPFITTAGVAD